MSIISVKDILLKLNKAFRIFHLHADHISKVTGKH